MTKIMAAIDGRKRILSILALVIVLWLRISGGGDYEALLLAVLPALGGDLDGVPVAELGVTVAALYAAYDGYKKNRAEKLRAETHVTPRKG